jgi:hypothetical protein
MPVSHDGGYFSLVLYGGIMEEIYEGHIKASLF